MIGKTTTILVADDDPGNLNLLRSLLSKAGYEILCVSQGDQVLPLAREKPPDLFLLDVLMPNLDGIEVCRRLKQEVWLSQVPVIFITAKHEIRDVLLGFEAGAADYIAKPINPPELLARVRTHIRLYHSILELERLNRLALDANPSTGLPGNNSINEAIARAIEDRNSLSIVYGDLDHFKAFNDKYGFVRGDQAIRYTADILEQTMRSICGPGFFLGHIGGDDFVLLIPTEKSQPLAEEIIRRFDANVQQLYDPGDVKAGGIHCENRLGKLEDYPIMSISLAVVDLSRRRFRHYLEVANECAEVKKLAKRIPGSSVYFDRRQT